MSVSDCVQDAISRWRERGAPTYSISYTAQEPHCIVRIFGTATKKDARSGDVINGVVYSIDGGAKHFFAVDE